MGAMAMLSLNFVCWKSWDWGFNLCRCIKRIGIWCSIEVISHDNMDVSPVHGRIWLWYVWQPSDFYFMSMECFLMNLKPSRDPISLSYIPLVCWHPPLSSVCFVKIWLMLICYERKNTVHSLKNTAEIMLKNRAWISLFFSSLPMILEDHNTMSSQLEN